MLTGNGEKYESCVPKLPPKHLEVFHRYREQQGFFRYQQHRGVRRVSFLINPILI